jgi:membrane-bound lytic murein transglycosylase B
MRYLVIASVLALTGSIAPAQTGDDTTRPVSRTSTDSEVSRGAVSLVSVTAPRNSLRPALRPAVTSTPEVLVSAATQSGFEDWIKGFRARAFRPMCSTAPSPVCNTMPT